MLVSDSAAVALISELYRIQEPGGYGLSMAIFCRGTFLALEGRCPRFPTWYSGVEEER